MSEFTVSVIINNVPMKGEALQWIGKIITDKIESTSAPSDTLANLLLGIAPQRGSKGSRKEDWEVELSTILKSLLKKYDLKINLRESGGIDSAVLALSRKMGRSVEVLRDDLTKKARHIASIKSASLDDEAE